MRNILLVVCCIMLTFYTASCSFDYGQSDVSDDSQPDIVMEDVEYVRIRSADPVARFFAERAERYENRQIMELFNFTFEQFGRSGEEVNAFGKAGTASVEIDTGDIRMGQGVRIDVESEDLAIETARLEWRDKDRILSAGEDDEVNIYQPNGTNFTGIGFRADARKRTWEFSGGVSGIFIQDEEEEAGEETAQAEWQDDDETTVE
ncbi:MAG: LPS export ABC transporter periplasmic protein LptC [Treponema sp.]|nr:LPS export ABC transporter periplasmic protein LptC [Treponema sp.]